MTQDKEKQARLDMFAAAAFTGLVAQNEDENEKVTCKWAYRYAEWLEAERERRYGGK
jgi:hypothetical protein